MMSGLATHQIAVMGAIGGKTVTIDELAEALPISRKYISAAACKLIRREYVERLETGVYSLTRAGREALENGATIKSGEYQRKGKRTAQAGDTLQQRAWTAMRLAGRFTVGDIAVLAANSQDKNPEDCLRRYFYRLTRAGYLVQLPTRVKGTAQKSNGFRQWRLLRDTGDQSPRWLKNNNALQDRNTGEVFPC